MPPAGGIVLALDSFAAAPVVFDPWFLAFVNHCQTENALALPFGVLPVVTLDLPRKMSPVGCLCPSSQSPQISFSNEKIRVCLYSTVLVGSPVCDDNCPSELGITFTDQISGCTRNGYGAGPATPGMR